MNASVSTPLNGIILPPEPKIITPKGWKISTSRGRSMHELASQWMSRRPDEKFEDLPTLVAHTKRRAEITREVKIDVRKIEVSAPEVTENDTRETALLKTGELFVEVEGGKLVTPTNWAFGQIAALAGNAPASYLKKLPTSIVSDALQYGLRYNRGAEEMKAFVDDVEALAFTGPDYGRIFNWELAEAVMASTAGATGDHRWKVPGMLDWRTLVYDPNHPVTPDTTTLFANDKGIFIFLCQDLAPIEIGKLPNGEPDLVFRGFYVTNSEVGAGSVKIGAMYLRGVCCNRILWGVEHFEEMSLRHTKYAPTRFVEEAMPALKSFAEGSTTKLIEGVHKAKEAVVANSKDETLQWLSGRNMSRKRALEVFDRIVREERQGDETDRPVSVWELAQGITAKARDEANFDTRMDMELEAKKLLDKVA